MVHHPLGRDQEICRSDEINSSLHTVAMFSDLFDDYAAEVAKQTDDTIVELFELLEENYSLLEWDLKGDESNSFNSRKINLLKRNAEEKQQKRFQRVKVAELADPFE